MDILILPLFVSFVLVMGAVLGYVYLIRNRELEHQDEASLMPLEDDE
ncbi:MAG: hypothetical protein IT286_01495 [Proteobacteria bacterium]|jgi:hypothetical protein|nr:hypothetical protein [Pseudomonadota bacterium]